ncbi:MAG: ATPase, T2SS/T4P/T4SS family [Planctomycetota bacterium]|nr:ATPase, T2SS/T4P/T4SS family [Planctomycetota bacterium]MDA1105035.1 ATPase, T2SS/T4P/T4SS family [Planctomycetota bacterium]
MARKSRKKLGEILVAAKKVQVGALDTALVEARASRKKIGEVLVEKQLVTEEDVARALGEQFGIEFFDLSKPENSARVQRKNLPDDIIKKNQVLPLEKENGKLRIVIHDPVDFDLLETLRFRVGETDQVISSRSQIREFLEGGSKGGSGGGAQLKQIQTSSMDQTVDKTMDRSMDKSIDADVGDSNIVRLVNRLIIEAVRNRASDIHVEPSEHVVRVRYRIDGVCLEVPGGITKDMQSSVLARLKLMAGMNIAERRIPQDGRIKMVIDEVSIDFRVSACPAYHGESVVLRILRPDAVNLGLEKLGFEPAMLERFNRIIARPNGIFLVTGPTGSGKTTTLYSALKELNTPNRKIITAEDPVEYNFEGIVQVQVREHIGLTFPIILKTMLRQAPNIILVGEIRDREVADIAIQAALTGHMVFSTLHTNDAPSAMTRLIDMGVKPFLVASSIQAIMAQRLARVLCPKCKEPDMEPDPKYLKLTGLTSMAKSGKILKGKGCAACTNGYKGRMAVFELLMMNQELRELAFARSTLAKLRSTAIRTGMQVLLEDGRTKILKGLTTPAEVASFAQVEGIDAGDAA